MPRPFTPASLVPKHESILRNLEDQNDFRLLAAMNGSRCARKQMRILGAYRMEGQRFVAREMARIAKQKTKRRNPKPEIRNSRIMPPQVRTSFGIIAPEPTPRQASIDPAAVARWFGIPRRFLDAK